MYDLAREQRRNRVLLTVNSCMLLGALCFVCFGRRDLVAWMLLVSCTINVTTSLLGRRALSRLSAASAHHDRGG